MADKMGYSNKASANTAIWTLRHNLVRKAGMADGCQAPDVSIDDEGRIVISVHDSAHIASADAGRSAPRHFAPEVNAEPSAARNLRKRKTEPEVDAEVTSSSSVEHRSTKPQATPSAKHQNDKKPPVEEPKQSGKTKAAESAQTSSTPPERSSLAQAQKNMGEALAAFLAKEAVEGEYYDLN